MKLEQHRNSFQLPRNTYLLVQHHRIIDWMLAAVLLAADEPKMAGSLYSSYSFSRKPKLITRQTGRQVDKKLSSLLPLIDDMFVFYCSHLPLVYDDDDDDVRCSTTCSEYSTRECAILKDYYVVPVPMFESPLLSAVCVYTQLLWPMLKGHPVQTLCHSTAKRQEKRMTSVAPFLPSLLMRTENWSTAGHVPNRMSLRTE